MFCRRRLSSFLPLLINQYKPISFTAFFDSDSTQLGLLSFRHLLFTVRSFSSISTDKQENDKQSFTISYLINSCGLPLKSAKSISKRVVLDNPYKPDSVLSLFRNHGFTDHQISEIVRRNPYLLRHDADKIILPKLQFLRSIGFSSDSMSILLTKNPIFLTRSLKQCLIPLYDILKCSLPDQDVLQAFNRIPLKTVLNLNYLNMNLSVLREIGMPSSAISLLLKRLAYVLCNGTDKFNRAVKEVVEMGFDPVLYTFAVALKAKVCLSESTWKRKIEAFKKWGISEDEVLAAFRKHPQCMSLSEESINNKMGFLASKMGWQPADVLKQPVVICCSLEKRIMPRCLIIKILLLKGLMKHKISLYSIVYPSDERFLNKYVNKHKKHVPELLDIFQGRMNVEEQGFGFDEICAASPVQDSNY